MDVLLMGVTPEHEFELGSGDDFADDVEDVVPDDALGGGKVTDAHLDDPAINVGDGLGGVAPLLAILLHWDIFGLPMIVLHLLVELVRPGVFEREDIEEHRLPSVDDALGSKSVFGFATVENECLWADLAGYGFSGHGSRVSLKTQRAARMGRAACRLWE